MGRVVGGLCGGGVMWVVGSVCLHAWVCMFHIPPVQLLTRTYLAYIAKLQFLQYLLICSMACFLVIFTARGQKEGLCLSLSFLTGEGHDTEDPSTKGIHTYAYTMATAFLIGTVHYTLAEGS